MVNRIAILGRGAAGKSTLARALSTGSSIPVTELDALFWRPGPEPMDPVEWERIHRELITRSRWIIDGDLGSYDVGLIGRLRAADTVIILDFPLWLCAWRSLRRSRETAEYWRWLIRYRHDSLPKIFADAAAAGIRPHVVRGPRALDILMRSSGETLRARRTGGAPCQD